MGFLRLGLCNALMFAFRGCKERSLYVLERRNFTESLSPGTGRGTKRFLQPDPYANNPVPQKIAKNRLSSEGIYTSKRPFDRITKLGNCIELVLNCNMKVFCLQSEPFLMENGIGSSDVLEKTHLSPGHIRPHSQNSSSPGQRRLGSTGTHA